MNTPTTEATLLTTTLVPGAVVTGVTAHNKRALFQHAGALFERVHGQPAGEVCEHLLAREKLGSTALGQGVAVPHARLAGIDSPMTAVMRLQTPLDLGAPDHLPVTLLIFTLVPQTATQAHLTALAELAEMLSDDIFRAGLLTAGNAEEVYQRLVAWQAPRRKAT